MLIRFLQWLPSRNMQRSGIENSIGFSWGRFSNLTGFSDLCVKNRKLFPCQQELFSQAELNKHTREGDGSVFKGHPFCRFCHRPFFDEEQLYFHLVQKHESCHICDKRGVKYQYFRNYASLVRQTSFETLKPHTVSKEKHFAKAHFLCPDESCRQKKFVVFEDQVQLQAHRVCSMFLVA